MKYIKTHLILFLSLCLMAYVLEVYYYLDFDIHKFSTDARFLSVLIPLIISFILTPFFNNGENEN